MTLCDANIGEYKQVDCEGNVIGVTKLIPPETPLPKMEQPQVKPKEKPLNRAELRRRESVNKEVQQVLAQSSQKFLTFSLNSEDPEGREVVERMEVLDAQWRTFCKRKHLIPAAYPLLKQEMNGIIEDYIKEKERGKETTEQPQPIE